MLIMFVLSVSPAASWITQRQTNAIFLYSKNRVCPHSVWIHPKACVCLEVQLGNSPTNLVNVCVVRLMLRSALLAEEWCVCFTKRSCEGTNESMVRMWSWDVLWEIRTFMSSERSLWAFTHGSVSVTVVSGNIACLTCRHWSLFCLL